VVPPTELEVGYQMGTIWSNALVYEELHNQVVHEGRESWRGREELGFVEVG